MTDTDLQSRVLITWIKYRDQTKPVEIWEVEAMIRCIREDVKLMIVIGKSDGWWQE